MIQNVANGLYAVNSRNLPGEAIQMNRIAGFYSIRPVGSNSWTYVPLPMIPLNFNYYDLHDAIFSQDFRL